MQIQVSDAASQWFRDELALQSGDAVRFFLAKCMVKRPCMMAFHWAWNALLLSSQLVRLLKMVSPILRVNRTNGFFCRL